MMVGANQLQHNVTGANNDEHLKGESTQAHPKEAKKKQGREHEERLFRGRAAFVSAKTKWKSGNG
eukprot:2339633-Amphidinium_carterae.1